MSVTSIAEPQTAVKQADGLSDYQFRRGIEDEFAAAGKKVVVGGANWPEFLQAIDARLPESLRKKLDRDLMEMDRQERYRGRQGMWKSWAIEYARYFGGQVR